MKIIILGSGIIGVCSAYFLAKKGYEVSVIDRQDGVSLETSYANAGQLSYSYCSPWAHPKAPIQAIKLMLRKYPPLVISKNMDFEKIAFLYAMLKNCKHQKYYTNKERMLKIAYYSKKCLALIEKETNIKYEGKKAGFLQILRTKEQLINEEKEANILNKFGVNYEILDVNGCIKKEPALERSKDKIFAGVSFAQDATGNCHKFSKELQKKCLGLGVKFEFNTNAEEFFLENSLIKCIKTNKGDFTADKFIVSMGSYSGQILRPLGIKIPIYPIKGYSITVPIIEKNRAPNSTVMDETYKIAITRLDNKIRVAGTAELNGYDLSLKQKYKDMLKYCVNSLFPEAADMQTDNFWTGLRPSTPDGTPIIGKTTIDNLFINSGHGTLGWTMSAGSGKLIADIVSNSKTDISIDGLDMKRYL